MSNLPEGHLEGGSVPEGAASVDVDVVAGALRAMMTPPITTVTPRISRADGISPKRTMA